MKFFSKNQAEGNQDPAQSEEEKNALLDAFAARVKDEITKEVAPLKETVTTLERKWTALEEEAGRSAQPDANKNADGSELTPEQKQANATRAIFLQGVLTNARITENEIIAEFSGAWPELVADFKDACSKTPPDQKALPSYAANCRNWIHARIGREAVSKGLRRDKNNAFIIEDGAAGADDNQNDSLSGGDYDWQDPRNPKKTLTGIQQLEKLGLTRKDFEEMQKNGVV